MSHLIIFFVVDRVRRVEIRWRLSARLPEKIKSEVDRCVGNDPLVMNMYECMCKCDMMIKLDVS